MAAEPAPGLVTGLVRLARLVARRIGRALGAPWRRAGGRSGAAHLRHDWRDIEVIGRVRVQECAVCRRTRVRVG